MTYKFETCVKENCEERCGKLTTYGNKVEGHCTVFNLCKCHAFRCEAAKCATYCKQKRPELYSGGHCSMFNWCKCETQAFKRYAFRNFQQIYSKDYISCMRYKNLVALHILLFFFFKCVHRSQDILAAKIK